MNLKIKKVIGCGGIGKGLLFHSPNNETLGRSESRLVTISNAKDYCKQQIVFYYIAELLKGKCEVIPVGAVGDDNIGTELVDIMLRQGMDVRYIKQISGTSTMLSICLQYPDKEGCNFTAQNNAAEYVKPGGVLVFSTCTIAKEENEENMLWFMNNHPFKLESIDPYLPEELHSETTALGYLQLLPGVHKTDGFFIAKFRRK